MYKQLVLSDRDRQWAKALKELLEANARWNEERRDAAKNDIRSEERIVDETGLPNPELRKNLIYTWKNGFTEEKDQETTQSPKRTILCKDEIRKSGQALTKPLKGKISAEKSSAVKKLDRFNLQKIGYRSSKN